MCICTSEYYIHKMCICVHARLIIDLAVTINAPLYMYMCTRTCIYSTCTCIYHCPICMSDVHVTQPAGLPQYSKDIFFCPRGVQIDRFHIECMYMYVSFYSQIAGVYIQMYTYMYMYTWKKYCHNGARQASDLWTVAVSSLLALISRE